MGILCSTRHFVGKFTTSTSLKSFKTVSLICLLMPSFVLAHGPTRQKVEQSVHVDAEPAEVWKVVGDFHGLDKWHPAVVKLENKDADDKQIRLLTIGAEDGPTITEQLKKLNDEKMMLSYKIIDMTVLETIEFAGRQVEKRTLPVDTYSSTMKVKAGKDGGSEVTWVGKFYRPYKLNPPTPEGMDDNSAKEAIIGVYRLGLDNLAEMFAAK